MSNGQHEVVPHDLACESIRFSFALRRWGLLRAKEKRILSQATHDQVFHLLTVYCS